MILIAWKVSIFGLTLVSIFHIYSVSLRIQSKCEKIRTRTIPNMDRFYTLSVLGMGSYRQSERFGYPLFVKNFIKTDYTAHNFNNYLEQLVFKIKVQYKWREHVRTSHTSCINQVANFWKCLNILKLSLTI